MAEPPDIDELARRYLDLWQDQWSAMMTDPNTAEAMTRFFELMREQMPGAASPFGAFAPGAKKEREDDDPGASAAGQRPGPAGAAPPGAAPDGGAERVDELNRRLAAVEERLARLEAQLAARNRP
jgi:hypothetical protein